MIEMPVLSDSPSHAEIVAWLSAAEKRNNDLWAKAIAKEKLKKAQQPRARG